MIKNKHLPSCLVVISVIFLSGAAEFPPFRIDDLDFVATERPEFDEPGPVDIPRVSERLYGAEELDRLPIKAVVIKGVVPHPKQNITPEIIQGIIDDKLEEEQAIALDDNGFTKRDLDDIGRFLREIVDRGSEPDEEDVKNLIDQIYENEFQRDWITIEQLDAIALAVTEHYRQAGFILATAFIPAQEVADGVIEISVLEGRLGGVTVTNNEVFEPATIKAAFSREIGSPVTEGQVESALRRINDLPGVRVRGSFSPGENIGETSLNLGVLQEQAWTSQVLADNHGSETTGEHRVFATTQWLDVWDKGHRLALGILRSEGPDSTTYGLVEYEVPVTDDGKGRVRGTISTNQFSVSGLANLPEIVGETDNFSLTGFYQFIRSRTLSFRTSVGYTQKDVLFKVGELTTLSTDQVIETFSVAADYTQLWDEQQLLLTGRFGIDQGHMISGELRDQSADFTKILLNANLLRRFSIDNWLTKNETYFNFVVKLNSQFSEKFLSSVEQFSLGGPNAVRAFGVSDVSVDSGAYAGFELFFDLPIDPVAKLNLPLDPIRPFLFYDYAYGVARGLGASRNRDAEIKGYGLGMRLNWPGTVEANLIFAKPQSTTFQNGFLDATGRSRIYLDVTYHIR